MALPASLHRPHALVSHLICRMMQGTCHENGVVQYMGAGQALQARTQS